jgi:hypothetical protein
LREVAEAMSRAVEILSSKGLELASQQQQPAITYSELPDYVSSRQGILCYEFLVGRLNNLQLFWRHFGPCCGLPS